MPLGAVFDFPAEHWIPLRATNPIESTFSTVRLRTRGTAALAMVFKLIKSAQQRWRGRAVKAAHLVPPCSAPRSGPHCVPVRPLQRRARVGLCIGLSG